MSFDASIEAMMNLSIGSSFVVNDSMQCTLKEDFTAWHKDCNSPAMFSESHVTVKADDHELDGMIVVQKDPVLSQKHYAVLYIKHTNEERWQNMFTINYVNC